MMRAPSLSRLLLIGWLRQLTNPSSFGTFYNIAARRQIPLGASTLPALLFQFIVRLRVTTCFGPFSSNVSGCSGHQWSSAVYNSTCHVWGQVTQDRIMLFCSTGFMSNPQDFIDTLECCNIVQYFQNICSREAFQPLYMIHWTSQTCCKMGKPS